MRMFFSSLFIFFIICLFCSCGSALKDNNACTNESPYADTSALLKYAGDSIKTTMDTTGLLYQIIDSGSGAHPTLASTMTVSYVARLMDNFIFDSLTNSNLGGGTLGGLIFGWRYGMPKIGAGGEIKLLIPSAYAWGCTGYNLVPPNAPVYFDIKLLSVGN
jgi:FKBP-type peptidyl-prolyl cis-trans isomerase FkpA